MDVVRGKEWIASLRDYTTNILKGSMKFQNGGNTVTLLGDLDLGDLKVCLKTMAATTKEKEKFNVKPVNATMKKSVSTWEKLLGEENCVPNLSSKMDSGTDVG